MNGYNELLQKALEYAKVHYPTASSQHQAAFANSVAYLTTGLSGGYGGPSLREHLVSWKLAGEMGKNVSADTNIGTATIQFPDGSIPQAGKWRFAEAVCFCKVYCFDNPNTFIGELYNIYTSEYCFDDDPEDVKVIKQYSGV